MFRREKQREFLPWYRQAGYRGRMTEAEKRYLDAIRESPPHPAVKLEQLPGEAQDYLNELELEAYDREQEQLVERCAIVSVVGALLIDANFLHLLDFTSWWAAITAIPLFVAPWLFYRWKWRQNADAFLPDLDAPGAVHPTDERLRAAWELRHIANKKRSA